jgi:hypothetical protein
VDYGLGWTEVASRSPASTYQGAGHVGIRVYSGDPTGLIVDDWGGGDIP